MCEARCALGLLAQPLRIMTGSRVTHTHTACSVQNTQNFTAGRAKGFLSANTMHPGTRLQPFQICLCLKVWSHVKMTIGGSRKQILMLLPPPYAHESPAGIVRW